MRVPQALFAASAAALVLVTLGHFIVSDHLVARQLSYVNHFGVDAEGNRVAADSMLSEVEFVVYRMGVVPGDEVHIPQFWVNGGDDVQLLVVEGGESSAFIENGWPEHVYVNMTRALGAVLERPVPPSGQEHPLEFSARAPPLDIVWIARDSRSNAATEHLDTWAKMLHDGDLYREPYALRAWRLDAQPWFVGAEILLGALVLGSGALAMRRPARADDNAPATPLEGALHVARMAGTYLDQLHAAVLLSGFLLLVMFVPSYSLVSNVTHENLFYWPNETVDALRVSFFAAYIAIVLVWLRAYLGVRRERARWRAASAAPPLG